MASYPNVRCPCGYSRFREGYATVITDVERWMQFDAGGGGGLGSTPLGTFFGGGGASTGDWGLFTAPLTVTTLTVSCESCNRARRTTTIGSFAVFGSYVVDRDIYIVGSDLTRPTGCYFVELVGADGETHALALSWDATLPAPLVVVTPPVVTTATPPADGRVDDVLRATLPDVLTTQTFTIVLVNRCAGTRTSLATIDLETAPMIFTPFDADLGGAPSAWLNGRRGKNSVAQPASSSRPSLPFDKAAAVLEYRAEEGTLPSAQGFVHGGSGLPGDYTLVPGGALLAVTAPALPSTWGKAAALTANPGEIYVYSKMSPIVETALTGHGDGFSIEGRYSQSIGTLYLGARLNRRARAWYAVSRGVGSSTEIRRTGRGWTDACVYSNDAADDHAFVGPESGNFSSFAFGTAGSPSAAIEMTLQFGDFLGTGGTMAIGSIVASAGGRFMRPRFAGVAPTSAPVLRVFGCADASGGPDKTVRFRVRYAAHGGSPYAAEALTADVTLNAVVANTDYEMSFTLPGLVALAPMTFTLERVISHADDKLDATFHVHYLTLRSS